VESGPEEPRVRPVLIRMMEGRVGSTLLMQLIGTSASVGFDRVYPFENSYLTYFLRLLQQTVAPPTPEWGMEELLYGHERMGPLPFAPGILDRALFEQEGLAALWTAFTRSIRSGTQSEIGLYAEKFWGDISPVIEAGLSPMVIDLVRDPRDVVTSIRSFNARRDRQSFGRMQADSERSHLRRLVIGMNLRLNEFEVELEVPRLLIRYEDLVSDLAREAARIEAHLGIRIDIAPVLADRASMAPHITSPSPDASVGRWTQELPAEDATYIASAMHDHMRALGY
jgi:hypothetical protein